MSRKEWSSLMRSTVKAARGKAQELLPLLGCATPINHMPQELGSFLHPFKPSAGFHQASEYYVRKFERYHNQQVTEAGCQGLGPNTVRMKSGAGFHHPFRFNECQTRH